MTHPLSGYFDASKGGSLSIPTEFQEGIDRTLVKLAQDRLFRHMIEDVDLAKEEFRGPSMIDKIEKIRKDLKKYIKWYVPTENKYSEEVSIYLSKKFAPYSNSITMDDILMEMSSYMESRGLFTLGSSDVDSEEDIHQSTVPPN